MITTQHAGLAIRKRIIQFDQKTGKQLEGTLVYVGVKSASIYGGDWFISHREASAALAKDPELTGRPLKVLLYLLSKLDYENWIQVPQTEIAEELGIHPVNVSKEINLLLRKKILIEQDHRSVKRIVRSMLGFKSFHSAKITLQGIELMYMIKKGQMIAAGSQDRSAAGQFYSLAA